MLTTYTLSNSLCFFFFRQRFSSKYDFFFSCQTALLKLSTVPCCSNQNSIALNVLLRPPCLASPCLPFSLITMLILGLHTILKMLAPIEVKQNKSNFPCEPQPHFSTLLGNEMPCRLCPCSLPSAPLLPTACLSPLCIHLQNLVLDVCLSFADPPGHTLPSLHGDLRFLFTEDGTWKTCHWS